jgi:hypothetical protein
MQHLERVVVPEKKGFDGRHALTNLHCMMLASGKRRYEAIGVG